MSHRDQAIKELYDRLHQGHMDDYTPSEVIYHAMEEFAVAKAERCLVLEEALRSIHKRFTEADQGTLHVRDGVAWAMDSDARAALEGK